MKLKLVVICLVIVILVYFGVSAWQVTEAMPVKRVPIEDSPASVGLLYEDVSFPSRDNITLRGWFIPGGPFAVVIITGFHTARYDSEIGTLEISRDLFEKGYSVLLFDKRGHGESEGEGITFVDFELDIGGAIDYIKSRGCSDIGIIGFSLGAAETLIFAAEEDVIAVVSDTCFANTDDIAIVVGAKEKGPELLVRFFMPGIFLMAKLIYGYEKVNPVDIVADVSCPILFIHGEVDHLFPVDDVYKLYEASGNPLDELWVVPGANHCQGYNTDPVGYIEKVASFLRE